MVLNTLAPEVNEREVKILQRRKLRRPVKFITHKIFRIINANVDIKITDLDAISMLMRDFSSQFGN